MTISKKPTYNKRLKGVLEYIAKDSPRNALRFKEQLDEQITKLPDMPYRCRQSHYYDDEQIRDLVFKGYTVPYLIDEVQGVIVVLDIFKWVER